MNKLARITALAAFVEVNYVSEGWSSTRFKELTAAVKTRLQNDHGLDYFAGLKTTWNSDRPESLHVWITGVVTDKCKYDRQWALDDGPIADAFLQDLQKLANAKALEQLEQERVQRFKRMAERRVNRMMEAADVEGVVSAS